MFQTLKSNFEKFANKSLFFRYVVSDLCWPTIHAVLAVLNLETIHDYSKRIYKYCTDEDLNPLEQKGFLASCISHSTHRFTRGLKRYVKFADKEQKVFVGCCFSLFAQTTQLSETKLIFGFMCEVFLRPVNDDVCTKAREALQQLIAMRPNVSSPVTQSPVSSSESQVSDDDLKINEERSTAIPAKRFFCIYCQKKFKNSQEIYQHNTGQKHKKNIFYSQTKFKVGAEVITNKDYEILMSEKEWLTDSVGFFILIYSYYTSSLNLDNQCLLEYN